MRTTLTLDDDVLLAARALAEAQKRTIGDVISGLVRRSLVSPNSKRRTRNGNSLLEAGAAASAVDLALVNALRDDAP